MDTTSQQQLGPCPNCGVADDVYLNIRAFGWAQEYYGQDGQYNEMDTDQVRYNNSDVVRCASCAAVRRDLIVIRDGMKTTIRQRRGSLTCQSH
jgi:hypothetical protein